MKTSGVFGNHLNTSLKIWVPNPKDPAAASHLYLSIVISIIQL